MEESRFTRTALTGFSYSIIAFFAFFEASIGPIVPFLEESLGIPHSVSGAHMSLFAAGMILGGQATPRLSRRWGRPRVLTVSLVVFLLGIGGLTAAFHAVLSLGSAFLLGAGGSVAFSLGQAFLSQHHGIHQGPALTEANLCASLGTTSLPLLIGLSLWAGLTWRGAFWGGALFFLALLFLFHRRTTIPAAEGENSPAAPKAPGETLPPRFYLIAVMLFLGVSVEWGIVFWGANYMKLFLAFPEGRASTLMSLLFFGMVISRFLTSRLTRQTKSSLLLAGAVGLTLTGLPLFLIPSHPLVNSAGLLIIGLGIANFYPLTLVMGFAAVPGQSDRISGLLSASAGLSILTAPFLLGLAADIWDLQRAHIIIFVLLFLMILLLAETARRTRRQTGRPRNKEKR